MIDIEFNKLHKDIKSGTDVNEIGLWLDEHMPNPPLPETQRWTIGYSTDGRVGLRFADEGDAMFFMLRWS
jgi:hypothetical protein